MKMNFIYLAIFSAISCTTPKQAFIENTNSSKVMDSNPLQGTWTLKYVLMGDAMDAPCGFSNEGKVKEMTVNFTSQKFDSGSKKKLHGQASVNSFMGSYTILSYDEKTQSGKLKLDPIASTKMASENPNFMECENRFLSYLEKSEDFKIEGGKLQLSKTVSIAKENSGSAPFGESYKSVLYLEKK
ncbi:META domain-containing protein [Flavobacterium sp.]|jgi:heat shock protein HslJ|uniref:META domain-containing protein n=1 Tax=Flavobacterium sp. TaxID=239 RepID=UPI0037BEB195